MKRVFDTLISGLSLLFLAPLLVLLGVLILTFNGPPVLFRQERIGYKGRPFVMYKFRTMVPNADRLGKPLTVSNDPRITKIGHWLRNSKLDELPQLINVIRGEMSLVGPRPEVDSYVALYTREQRRVLSLIPGITDPASIRYRHESELLNAVADPEQTYIKEILPDKIHINLEYASRRSILRDCGVILRTLSALCRGKAAVFAACGLTLTTA